MPTDQQKAARLTRTVFVSKGGEEQLTAIDCHQLVTALSTARFSDRNARDTVQSLIGKLNRALAEEG